VIVPASRARTLGEWKPSQAGEEYLQKEGGTSARIVYEAKVPEDGVYDLYMKLPKGEPNFTGSASYLIPNIQIDFSKDRSERAQVDPNAIKGQLWQTTAIDQSAVREEGWVLLGTTNVKGGINYSAASILTNEPENGNATIAGPLMLILNQKATREAATQADAPAEAQAAPEANSPMDDRPTAMPIP
jgi:hypothetical protein